MKKFLKSFWLLVLTLVLSFSVVACTSDGDDDSSNNGGDSSVITQKVDLVGQLSLNMDSSTVKQEVELRLHVDGDTTHFNVPRDLDSTGILKARYLGINTPESTGNIEPYGKEASDFTKNIVKNAHSLLVESNNNVWNKDNNGRYLVYVWYKLTETSPWRNLNVELIQEGLAIPHSAGESIYGDEIFAASRQADALKLGSKSGKPAEGYYYGTAIEIDLKELRTNIADYANKKVAFNAIITKDYGGSIYVQSYDAENDVTYGISVYYGYGATGNLLEMLVVGNEVRIVGTVTYWEGGGTYQISDIKYNAFLPDHPDNTTLISTGNSVEYPVVSVEDFLNKQVEIEMYEDEDGNIPTKTFGLAELLLNTTISMENLVVTSIYTTNNGGDSDGAMTLTCKSGDNTIKIRTEVLRVDGEIVTADAYQGKTIDVKGLVDYYNGSYQIAVYSVNDIIVH